MNQLPFTDEEIKGVDYRLSNDIPVKVFRDNEDKYYRLGFYILEEVSIGTQFPHITFDLTKNQKGYRLTDHGYAHKVFGDLLNFKPIQFYQQRLGIGYDPEKACFYIQMPLLNSVEAYTHRILELMTQIKTIADLKQRNLLK
ncbi:hypothetical protein [Acetilactobacillus jinshanensis]|uniref:Uncharacterized protein n=1 Tax=Acetilactobacillus jinshanensis TaxID=1720083 RepID=A0A4V1ALR5_9LACO|nr:hypothetical protein [Acetilactobacillus jinshanensis]QBP18519.1 hypothetical protein ELX58_05105 [Acetilactobacillus jinshanensis]URL61392.1 hypothetical protein HGK75_05230 [uncultured bacterium]